MTGLLGHTDVRPSQDHWILRMQMVRINLAPFLHSQKQDRPNIEEDDVVISQEIAEISTSRSDVPVLPSQLQIQQQEPNPEKVVYLPKQEPEIQNLILVPARMKKTTSLQAYTRPVPEELQDDHLHYCTKCEAKYTMRDELNRHKSKNCQVKEPEFLCDKCDGSFFWSNTICKHYYKEHIRQFLYRCRKCGKGFDWKSRIPDHNKICPMKDGPDKYQSKLPYDEKVEEKFKRKKAVPLVLPEDDLQPSEQEQQQQGMSQPSIYPPVQSTDTPDQATPQVVGEEDPQLEDLKNPLGPVLPTASTDLSGPVEQTVSTDPSDPIQPLSYGAITSTTDNVLSMLSEGRLPNIASEIQAVEVEEDEDKKPVVLDVENKFNQ